MNILYLTNHLNIGGITSYCFSLALGMKRRGHAVFVASSGGRMLKEFTKAGIDFFPIPIKTKQELSPGILISAAKLRYVIKENNISLVHSNSRTTQVLGCLLQKLTAVRHISTCHGFFKPRFSRKLFPSWGDKTIAISEAVRGHLAEDFKVRPERITVIHSGIDLQRFREADLKQRQALKHRLQLDDKPVIGIIARLSEEKGHEYLIKAMKEVSAVFPKACLVIVGEGRMREKLDRLIRKLEIAENIIFLNSQERTEEILPAFDIFVLPSIKEGLGLAAMEAQASSIAVIGTDVGGIKSLIRNDYNGILIKPADSQALAEAIIALLKDAHKRQEIGKMARAYIAENFSLEKMVDETERVYLRCLEKRN